MLAKCPLFKGINQEIIDSLIKSVNCKVKTYDAEFVIASRDEEVKNLMIVMNGSVRGEMLDYSGKVLKVEDIYAPEPIASAFIFGNNNRFPVDVVVNKKATILQIPRSSILSLFQENGQFLHNYLNAISNRAQFLSRRIWFLSFKTIKGKIAQYILNIATDNRVIVDLGMTQKQLSEFFGVTRPSLARALGEMEKDGCILVNRKEIEIIKRNELLNYLE